MNRKKLIDADAFMKAMYHRAFETDGDTMWQSGCWVRYRAIEEVMKAQPTIGPESITANIDRELTQDDYEKLRKEMQNAQIMILPSVQPEIIRCKNCEYYNEWNVECNHPDHRGLVHIRTRDDFCSAAKRRE